MPSAIVTGASQGLGKAIALRLAQDGFDICVNDITPQKAALEEVAEQIKATGRKATSYIADVSKRAEVDAMVAESARILGPLHVMVANAGIVQVKALLDLTDEDLQRMFGINVFGMHNCYAAAARQFISQGKPSPSHPPAAHGMAGIPLPSSGVYKIIGAASVAAFKPWALLGHYGASKWAVRGLTQAFATEMAEHGITVNAYAPGIVGTAMWDTIDEEMGKRSGRARGETLAMTSKQMITMGRTSVPEDVSNVVHFLASKESDYMTGQTVIVDGGIIFT